MVSFCHAKEALGIQKKESQEEEKWQRKGKAIRKEVREEKQNEERERKGKGDKQGRISANNVFVIGVCVLTLLLTTLSPEMPHIPGKQVFFIVFVFWVFY